MSRNFLRPCSVIKNKQVMLPTGGYKLEQVVNLGYLFHEWGTEVVEGDQATVTNATVAIVESPDGTVELLSPSMIRLENQHVKAV